MDPSSVPLGPPEITAADIAAVVAVLQTPRLSRGPAGEAFEAGIAESIGVRHAVAVSSGTSGLHLAVRALELGPDDEVITTPFSFVASANALVYERVKPVFVDVQPDDLCLDPDRVEAAITARTRAILPVHVYGRPASMPRIRAIADRYDLAIVEDACEALGSEIGGRRAGAWGDLGVLSFYPNKQITTGEGGVVVTDDDRLAARVRRLRNQGRSSSPDGVDQVELGFSYRLPEMSCALGASQLTRLEAIVTRRAAVAAAYERRLGDLEAVRTPGLEIQDGRISWFVYAVRLADRFDGAQRDRIIARMRQRGVECAPYFVPIHLQPYYRALLGHGRGDFPITEAAGERMIALPFFNRISEAQIERVCQALVEALPG